MALPSLRGSHGRLKAKVATVGARFTSVRWRFRWAVWPYGLADRVSRIALYVSLSAGFLLVLVLDTGEPEAVRSMAGTAAQTMGSLLGLLFVAMVFKYEQAVKGRERLETLVPNYVELLSGGPTRGVSPFPIDRAITDLLDGMSMGTFSATDGVRHAILYWGPPTYSDLLRKMWGLSVSVHLWYGSAAPDITAEIKKNGISMDVLAGAQMDSISPGVDALRFFMLLADAFPFGADWAPAGSAVRRLYDEIALMCRREGSLSAVLSLQQWRLFSTWRFWLTVLTYCLAIVMGLLVQAGLCDASASQFTVRITAVFLLWLVLFCLEETVRWMTRLIV